MPPATIKNLNILAWHFRGKWKQFGIEFGSCQEETEVSTQQSMHASNKYRQVELKKHKAKAETANPIPPVPQKD